MGSDLDSNSPRWSSLLQTTEDVARAVAAAAASVRSPRTSVVYSSSKDDSDSPIKRIQKQFSKIWKGMSPPTEKARGSYNPEILASHKRQWARFQIHSWDHKSVREPSRMFESIVVLGLHPESDIRGLQTMVSEKNCEGLRRQRSIKDYIHGSHKKLKLEPQVLFVYPPEKQLPLKYKDLLSFCFPGGVEVHTIERTPSMSELNEILIGQDHFRQSDLSFVFRLQVADDSTLYGCCVLVEEIVQKPSGLISMISDDHSPPLPLTRHVFTTLRCYCILSKLPFFDMHFGMLKSIFIEERLDRVSKGVNILNLMSPELSEEGNGSEPSGDGPINPHLAEILIGSSGGSEMTDMPIHEETSKELPDPENVDDSYQKPGSDSQLIIEEVSEQEKELKSEFSVQSSSDLTPSSERILNKESSCKPLPGVVFPLLWHHACESSESSTSFQDSPSEDRNCRSDMDDTETEYASSSGQDDFGDHQDILKWAKANGHGALQIICEYYCLKLPERGASLTFHPLEHLHPVLYQRPMEPVLHVSGSAISLKLDSYLDVAEAYNALVAEEEVTTLSIWTVACICGNLRLDNILTMIAGALLEKQIVVVCSDVGLLSASVLSMIPLIWPYRWQSLLMTVLPNDMLDFLDAPVPYIVGMRNITTEVQSKTSNSILVDVNKNQVRCPTIPQLPRQRELFASLSSYHAALVGESYLAKKRPVYEYTEAQAEAAKGFLITFRHYLESFCSNLRAHTITSVQSNDDKVSLLWRESFIDSFPSRDRSFMKLFVDTQLFSVYTDLALSVYQKE